MDWMRSSLVGLLFAACAAPAFADGMQDLTGGWARDDGTVKINIAPCGSNYCAVNTFVTISDTKEHVGDKLILTLKSDSLSEFKGEAYDVRRQKSYAVTITLQGKAMNISGCILAGILCKSAGYTQIN